MRSAIIAAFVAVAAAVPLTETIYNTQVYTITSCGPEVTDCPGKKTTVSVSVGTTTCPEKDSYTAPPVYKSTSSPVAPPVYKTSSAPAPPPEKPTTYPAKPSTSEAPVPPPVKQTSSVAIVTSSAPAPPPEKPTTYPAKPSTSEAPVPPPVKPSTSEAPAPPPAKQTSTPVAAPSSKVTSKPAVGTSVSPSGSTGIVPYKTTSASWSQTSSPAKYTGAANHLNAAGAIVGAGAFAALFL